MKLIAKITLMDDEKLSTLFQNAQNMLLKANNVDTAKTVITAIEKEWAHRLTQFRAGQYKADTPREGVLKAIGYRVGNNGLPEPMRHHLLDFAMTGTLPPIGSPAHMAEWGEPCSRTRYAKLHRVIRVFASSAHALGNMEKAAEEWEEDLVYIEQKWQEKCRR